MGDVRRSRGLRARALTGVLALAATIVAPPVGAQARGGHRTGPARSLPARGSSAQPVTDPALTKALDAVVRATPGSSCLVASIDGEVVYTHRGTAPLVPASTEKLFTARVVLDRLGADTRFETRAVAAAAPVDGVIKGDLTIVGSGDPVLVTDQYRVVRRIGPDDPTTSLDDLAAQLQAAGIRRVTGRVVGDASRYDDLRTGPGWPERFTTQDQSGPLSALAVDDGYDLTIAPPGGGRARRARSTDPAASAARLLSDRLRVRGIAVDGAGYSGSGSAPRRPIKVAEVASPPVAQIVAHMLRTSDNQVAELLTKELGVRAGQGGSTTAGAEVIQAASTALGIDRAASRAVDGSGLDPRNRVSCRSLVSLLDGAGPDGALAAGLPVAGRDGTLRNRFRGTPAEAILRAKTGSLDGVTALAGFVQAPDGPEVTFAYVANGEADADASGPVELLGTVLAEYRPACDPEASAPLVAPVSPYAGGVGNLAMFPLQSVLVPGAIVPLHVFEERYRTLVDRCVAMQEDFGVTLISRGSEVGGGDVRTDVGTRGSHHRSPAGPRRAVGGHRRGGPPDPHRRLAAR